MEEAIRNGRLRIGPDPELRSLAEQQRGCTGGPTSAPWPKRGGQGPTAPRPLFTGGWPSVD